MCAFESLDEGTGSRFFARGNWRAPTVVTLLLPDRNRTGPNSVCDYAPLAFSLRRKNRLRLLESVRRRFLSPSLVFRISETIVVGIARGE
jgi:hypothetical protein